MILPGAAWRTGGGWALLGILFTLLAVFPGFAGPLLTGWARFAAFSIRSFQISWLEVGEFAISLLVFAAGIHVFCRWLARSRNPESPWRGRWTWTLTAGLLLVFVIGLAGHGLARQGLWLARALATVPPTGSLPLALPAGG